MAEAEVSLEELEKEVTCAFCQEHYTEPKVLPCLHYYCKKCIIKLTLKTGTEKPFSCPECRKEITLSEGGVDELRTAFFISHFKSKFFSLEIAQGKVEVTCEACSSNSTAVAFCRQCVVFICSTCVEAHQKLDMLFDNHQVISMVDLKEDKAKADITMKEPSAIKCKIHKKSFKVYCFDCDLQICRDCTMKDHRDHNIEFTSAAAPEMREGLMKELQPLRELIEYLTLAVEKVQSIKQEVQVQGDSVASTVKAAFTELLQIVEQCQQDLLEEAKTLVGDKVEKLSVQEKNLMIACSEVRNVVDYIERCVSHCSDNEIMSMLTEMRNQMKQESQKSERSMEPVEEADMGVEMRCAEALQQLCQTKAKITQLVDPARCTVRGDGMEAAEVHKIAEVTLITSTLTNNKTTRCSAVVVGQLKSLYNQSVIQCDVDQSGLSEYRIQYTPTVRGRHELTVSVDGQQVAGSPFPVFVSIPPTQLGNPVSIWKDIPKPTGISMNSKGEVIVLKAEDVLEFYKAGEKLRSIGRNLLKLDSYTFTSIPVDAEDFMYLYSYDSNSNTMMKHDKDGHVVKKVNISSKLYGASIIGNELFACEHDKNTIAVYDRELNYVRRIEQQKETGQLRDNSADADGNIYATDWDRKCVVIFGP